MPRRQLAARTATPLGTAEAALAAMAAPVTRPYIRRPSAATDIARPRARRADCAEGYGACVSADAAAGVPPPRSKLPACDAAPAAGDEPLASCLACPRGYTSAAAPLWSRPECVAKRSPYAVTFSASVGAACEGLAVIDVQSTAQDMLSTATGASILEVVVGWRAAPPAAPAAAAARLRACAPKLTRGGALLPARCCCRRAAAGALLPARF